MLALRQADYWATVYRRVWRGTVVTSFVLPVLYLAAIGVGLGRYVDAGSTAALGGLSYLDYVGPGLLATTAGGVFIDLFSGVTPEIVRPCEHIVTTAILASGVYAVIALIAKDSTQFFPITLISVLVAFVFRILAVRAHWSQIVPRDAAAQGPLAATPASPRPPM